MVNEAASERTEARPRQFVLQVIDPDTGCPVLESRFTVEDISVLAEILDKEADGDPDIRCSYSLDDQQLTAIAQKVGAAFDAGGRPAALVPWHSIRRVPYLVHTGFELALMLEGRKPLAVFADIYPGSWSEELLARFAPYVSNGRFVRRIVDRPFPEVQRAPDGALIEGTREVYVAAPGEEWRIEAFLMLREVAAKSGWNDTLERFEGSLLGYEDWQNDWWIENRRRIHDESAGMPRT